LTPSRKSKSYKAVDGVGLVPMTPISKRLSTISPFVSGKRDGGTPSSNRKNRTLGFMRGDTPSKR
jgi:hypothetical protein